MENLIWDGVPVQRQRRGEKFNFAVVTMSAVDKPGAGRKFSFNKAAQDVLGIQGEDRVSFGFSTDRTIIAIRKAAGDAGLIQLLSLFVGHVSIMFHADGLVAALFL